MQKALYLDSINYGVHERENQVPEMQRQQSETTDKLLSDQDLKKKLIIFAFNWQSHCR